MAQFDTVANIVGDVGTEVGLGTLTVSYTSTDDNVLRLLKLLTVVGRDLIRKHRLLQNRLSTTFSAGGTAEQSLATDALSLVDGSLWDRTNDLPLRLLTPSEWEYHKAIGSTYASYPQDVRATRVAATGVCGIEFFSTPTGSPLIAYEYWSSYWVAVDASNAPTKDAPTLTTDVVRIDSHLATRALRLAWLRAKGYASEAAQQDYEDILASVLGANQVVAPVLPVGGRARDALDFNVPETGYGT